MNDTKILSAIKALHERFVEEPTDGGAWHIMDFIERSEMDMEPPMANNLKRYYSQISCAFYDHYSPKSIAHLNEVAKECLG